MHPEPDALLRERLSALVKRKSRNGPLTLPADQHKGYVKRLAVEHRHSVSFVALDSDVRRPPKEAACCYEYTLGLLNEPRYWEIVHAHAEARPIPAFGLLIEDLITAGLESTSDPADGDLVTYFSVERNCYTHVGSITSALVHSKWGADGCVWNHGLWEVPHSYGNDVRFYKAPGLERVLDEFAKQRRNMYRVAVRYHERKP